MSVENSPQVVNGWTDSNEAQDWTTSASKFVPHRKQFSIICGVKMDKYRAQHLFNYWQFMYGEMSTALEAIHEFKLTRPLPVAVNNKFFGRGDDYENGRTRNAIANYRTDPRLRSAIMAKKAVASGHVVLHESFLVERAMVPRAVAFSLWNQALYVPESYDFRDCRNFFCHAFLRTDLGNDLRYYKTIKKMYTEHLPVLKALIEKLQSGLSDESAWKKDETELSWFDRPGYALDTPDAEVEAKEQKEIKDNAENASPQVERQVPDCDSNGWAVDEAPKEPLLDSPENSVVAWLSETWDYMWEPNYRIERRQSWSHFYVGADGKYWM